MISDSVRPRRSKLAARLLVALFLSLIVPSALAQQRPPVWVILHMANSNEAVKFGARAGANAIEADLIFDRNGVPTDFYHGFPCDCTCFVSYGVCRYLGTNPCYSRVSATELLATVRGTPQIGLVVIDSKVDRSTNPAAGARLVYLVEAELFRKGYPGMVIIGAPKLNTFGFLNAAATAASGSPYAGRIFFTIDGEEDKTAGVLQALVKLPVDGLVYGTGISACSAAKFHGAIALGQVNRRAGVIGFNYIWTIDKPDSAFEYLDRGADGIMTNDPGPIVQRLLARGYTLATPGTFFPRATSRTVQTAVPNCDCSYRPGGCVVNSAATSTWACRCTYSGGWTCAGSAVICQDPSSAECRSPTTSFESCLQGRGDCQGYKEQKCDCNYVSRGLKPSGCKLSRASPPNTACKCSYKGAWTCGGSIVPCRNWTSQSCKSPSLDLASCREGGGDCKGY